MDKQAAIIEAILKTVRQEVEQWIEEERIIKDPFLHEKRLLERLLERSLQVERAMMEGSGGKLARDRNVKKRF